MEWIKLTTVFPVLDEVEEGTYGTFAPTQVFELREIRR